LARADLQASHSKYQGSCRQAEKFGFLRGGIDFLAKPSRVPGSAIPVPSSKVGDEKVPLMWSSIERNDRKLRLLKGLPQTSARPAFEIIKRVNGFGD